MKLKDLLRESDEYSIYHSISKATTMADAVASAEKYLDKLKSAKGFDGKHYAEQASFLISQEKKSPAEPHNMKYRIETLSDQFFHKDAEYDQKVDTKISPEIQAKMDADDAAKKSHGAAGHYNR